MSSIKFNEKQLQAINHIDGNMVIYAGAGSGKTSVLIERTINMIRNGINPSDIMLITFTRNSANDLKKKLSKNDIEGVAIGTFHSICATILSKNGINVSKKLPEWVVENLFNRINGGHKVDVNDVLGFISYQKNYMRSYDDEFVEKESMYSEVMLRQFFKAYEEEKDKQYAYDFDDYLLECLKLLEEHPNLHTWKYLMVDECQDNNSIQDKLMKLLCPYNNITMVGDFRQAIYPFRGSVPELFINAPNKLENPNVVHMNINYRSDSKIVNAANEFARNYFGELESFCDAEAASPNKGTVDIISCIDKDHESVAVLNRIKREIANGTPLNEIAVLYRNNDQIAYVEMLLKENNIPYEIESNGSFFNKKEVDIIMCVLRLMADENDNSAYEKLFKYRVSGFRFLKASILENIRALSVKSNTSFMAASRNVYCEQNWQRNGLNSLINIVNQGRVRLYNGMSLRDVVSNIINELNMEEYIANNYTSIDERKERLESLESLKQFIREGHSIASFLKFAYETSQIKKKSNNQEAIKLMTIHKSKGLEWDVVFVIGLVQGKFPSMKATLNEEASVGYVAFTRARNKLCVVGEESSLFFKEFEEIVDGLS